MGASNFGRTNASAVFAVLMDEEVKNFSCSDCHYSIDEHEDEFPELDTLFCCPRCESEEIHWNEVWRSPEHWDIDNFFEYLEETLDEHYKHSSLKCEYFFEGSKDYTNLFSLRMDRNFGDINVDVRVYGTMESGYHEGAKLDWRIECNDSDTVHDLEQDFDNSDMSRGLQVIQTKNAIKWADKVSQEMIELIERVYTEISLPLRRVGGFSDGTSIYEPIIKKDNEKQ